MNSLSPEQTMLRTILDTVEVGVFTFDKDRKVLFSNAAAIDIFRFPSVGAGVGKADPGHFERNEYYDENGDLIAFPKDSVIDLALKGEQTHDLFLEHRNTKDHTHQWISISCVPIMKDGVFEYGILWCRDISKRKSQEDKLKFLISSTRILSLAMEFEKRLRENTKLFVPTLADWAAFDLVNPDLSIHRIALVHRDSKKIEWIKEYEAKYPTDPNIETNLQRIVRTNKAEFTPIVTSAMIDAVPNLSDTQREDIRRLQLSSVMTVRISTGGKVLGLLTLAYAESGRVYTEEDFEFVQEFANHLSVLMENARLYSEIRQRENAKDAFLASLSHELRNPLAPIRTSLELLRIKNPEGMFREEIDSIAHQFAHLTRLLNDLLDSTRFARGKINIVVEPTDLIHVIEQVTRSVKPLFEESDIRLHLSYPPKQLLLAADRTRLEQALTNILSNAVKFTPKGGSIWIEVIEKDEIVQISVKDNGAGITPDEMNHIFDPYYQSERVRAGNTGLGIGLSLVNEIVRLHKGTIDVKSDGPGTGSEFIITLPNSKPTEEYQGPASMPHANESSIKQILIVDDNKAAADVLARLLIALGWKADVVYSGASTLSYLDTHSVDMIFLDIGMPDMSGYELVQLLRKRPDCKDLPIVAVTGYGLEDDKQRALDAGFTAHITKPMGAQELRGILTKDLKK